MIVLLAVFAASEGISGVLHIGRVRSYLVARLSGAFGRPVEVREFAFSVLDGLRIEANAITVGEDPRFGYEYFLRADRLTASPRWTALFAGRFEFGTLSFTRPSLNLVRSPEGRWNLEDWLPPSATGAPPSVFKSAAAGSRPPLRLSRIEVDGGRINFQRGPDRHPFALVDVEGEVTQESVGRWQFDLETRPVRSGIILQEAGTLRLRGFIAGTSTRLQPAQMQLLWLDASLADALRLLGGRDFGVRGRLSVDLNAQSGSPGQPATAGKPGGWALAGVARFTGMHRWDFAPRAGDPAVNLILEADWQPGERKVELPRMTLEAPQSILGGTGAVDWSSGLRPAFYVQSRWISFADVLPWLRAFRGGVGEDLTAEGGFAFDAGISGWPPRLDEASLASEGVRLRSAAFRAPLRSGRLAARLRGDALEFEPTTLAFAVGASAKGEPAPRESEMLRLDGRLRGAGNLRGARGTNVSVAPVTFEFGLAGQTARVQDFFGALRAFGQAPLHEWALEGAANANLQWQGSILPFAARTLGTLELRDFRLRASFLNQPLVLAAAKIELRPGERRVVVSEVQAFGAKWKGTLRSGADAPWEFDLSADHLDAAELDRWLGPRARPGFLERMNPFGGGAREPATAGIGEAGELRASGRLSVDEFRLTPFVARRVRAEMELASRTIGVRKLEANFYGGAVKGSLEARLGPNPAYSFLGDFDAISLAALCDASVSLKTLAAGTSAGHIELAATGIGREALIGGIEGSGTLRVRSVDLPHIPPATAGKPAPATTAERARSRFQSADVRFSIARSIIWVEALRLANVEGGYEGQGSVDFARRLDIRLRTVTVSGAPLGDPVRVTGSLEDFKSGRAPAPPEK